MRWRIVLDRVRMFKLDHESGLATGFFHHGLPSQPQNREDCFNQHNHSGRQTGRHARPVSRFRGDVSVGQALVY